MAKLNDNYLKLKAGYLFPEIGRRVSEFAKQNPDKKIIRMGIGDVTQPLTPTVVKAFHDAVDEMANIKTFKGYGPENGYDFLRDAILQNDYKSRGVDLDHDEIFISDGAKCDTGNILEIFSLDNVLAICDPVYPVYIDSSVMGGRTGIAMENGYYEKIVYMPCNEENNFLPAIPKEKVDIIFLCFPNNPTGATADKAYLKKWVDYAIANKAVIMYDSAYEAFIQDPTIPHSIYEIEGAKQVAIEFRSFSKTAGFTGTRCAYNVIPKKLLAFDSQQKTMPIHPLWLRRQTTKFNGVSYPVQKAAAAIFSPSGQAEVKKVIDYYMENAKILKENIEKLGFKVYGGVNAPYIWVKTKDGMKSWEFFDWLLHTLNIVGTPGSGFGPSGEGFVRFSSFALRENVLEAVERLKNAKF